MSQKRKKDHAEVALPASIAAAWGLDARSGKGPRRGLSLERIVAAAIDVAVADGLGAVSMSRVAADLGRATMSLYRYVDAKEDLLALMVDAAFGAPEAPAPGEGWRAGLSRWAWAHLNVLRRHPWILRVPIGGPPATPHLVAWMEWGLACLQESGLPEREKVSVMTLLSGFVRNEATLTATIAEAYRARGASAQHLAPAYGRLLARLTDPARHPALQRVLAAGVFEGPGDPDEGFVFGLERVLDGIETLVRSRRRGPAKARA